MSHVQRWHLNKRISPLKIVLALRNTIFVRASPHLPWVRFLAFPKKKLILPRFIWRRFFESVGQKCWSNSSGPTKNQQQLCRKSRKLFQSGAFSSSVSVSVQLPLSLEEAIRAKSQARSVATEKVTNELYLYISFAPTLIGAIPLWPSVAQ